MKPNRQAIHGPATLSALAWLSSSIATSAAGLPADDPLRLDPSIRPITQALELRLDPAADTYSGSVRIELNFDVATNRFRFHAAEIALGKATLDGKPLTLTSGEAAIVSAALDETMVPGRHVLEIAFTNNYRRDARAIYKVITEGQPRIYSYLNPEYGGARRAFPCWDEPTFKIPWRLTLVVPKQLEVVGNMPIAQTTETNEWKKVEFGRSPPMPSYLVALAVGVLEFTPIEGASVPGRMVTVTGKSPLILQAAQEVPALLAGLEKHLGIPMPYPKLDHLIVPERKFAAMEDAGAISYPDSVLYRTPRDDGADSRERLLQLAHEMAHMWFGNLVTPQWWNDAWLSESLAEWAAQKIVRQVRPDLRFEDRTLILDYIPWLYEGKPSAQPIRRSFRGGENYNEAFDRFLTYEKGSRVVSLVENWIGASNFQAAVQRYLHRHQWGNAQAEDFWAAFAGEGDGSVPEIFRRYVEQPGIPELKFARLPGDRLHVRQGRYRTLETTNVTDQLWHVPIFIRYGSSTNAKTARLLLKEEEAVFNVPELDQSAWIDPNSGGTGYYVWNGPPDLFRALARPASSHLTAAERRRVIESASNAVRSGQLPAEMLLELAIQFLDDDEPEVIQRAFRALEEIAGFVIPDDRPSWKQFLGTTLRPKLDMVGFQPKPNETKAMTSRRKRLLTMLGSEAGDPDVVRFCRDVVTRQMADAMSERGEIDKSLLAIATVHGDAAWADQLRTAYQQAKDPKLRRTFLKALTGFRDPDLLRAGLNFALAEPSRSVELLTLLTEDVDRKNASVRFEWVVEHYDVLKKEIPARQQDSLVWALEGADKKLLAKAREFFGDPSRRTRWIEANLTQLEDLSKPAAAIRQRFGASLSKYIRDRLGQSAAR